MRILGIVGTLVLFLFLISPAPGYAQDRDEKTVQEQTKPEGNNKAKENDRAKQEDKNTRQDEGKPQEPDAGRRDEHQNQPEASRPEERRGHQQGEEQHPMENNRHGNQGMGRDQNQHPAAERGKHIPDDRFRAHFGRQHTFHVQRSQIVNISQPVIVYGGYSFELIDAWPAAWSYDDDCYIDYVDDEYFLFDVLHPGIRIAVFVVG